MYSNINNIDRVILKNNITLDTSTFDTIANTAPFKNIKSSFYYSSLRIIIGYGRGGHNTQQKSDDIVIYISPPIVRKTYILTYDLDDNLTENLSRINITAPYTICNNSLDFIYYPTEEIANSNTQRIHIQHGLGNYETVVNSFPPLPETFTFNYRIVENFTKI